MRISKRLISIVRFVKVMILTGMGFSIVGVEGVYAQNAVELEEIIVTAQRRETNLQDTPIAITALSGDDMRARSLSNTSELAQYVPNLSITPGAGNSRSPSTPQVFIRGIGQNDFIINSDPGVGLYVDGVYVSRVTGSILDLLDVDRIEVLRGPQGTLFGKNTIGGAINVTTRSPSDKLTYEAEVLGGSYDRIEGRAYVSGPLSDKVAGKAAIAYKSRQGHGKRFDIASGNVTGRTGGNENIIGRAGLRIEISDALTLDLSGDVTFNRDEQLTGSMEFFATDPAQGVLALYNGLVGVPSGILLTSALEIDNRYDSYANGFNFSDQDIYGGSAVLTWDVSAVTIKSITAYRTLDSTLGSDGDGSPLPYLGSVYTLDQSQLSQELQMYGESFGGRFSWLTGLYYLNENANELTFGFLGDGLFNALEMLPAAVIPFAPGSVCPGPFPPNVCLGGAGNPFNPSLDIAIDYDYGQTVNSYAAFGEGTLQLSDDFALSVGLRFTEEDKTLDVNGIVRRNSGQVIVPAGTQRKLSFAALTPRFRLEFTPTDDLLLYVSMSRGFKSGGINGRVFDAITLTEFNPEFVWAYEGGFKADLFSRRLRVNAAVFRNNYRDMQTTVQNAATGSINVFIANAAAAEITGFELEANARANEYFDLGGSLAYLDTKITKTDAGVQQFSVGDRLQKAPKWSFTTYGQFTYPVSAGYEVLLRADYSFKSDYFNDPLLSQNIRQGDFGLLSLRLELASDRGWTLAAFGTNLTDQDYIVAGLDTTTNGIGTVERIYGRPREWGLSLRYKY